MLSTILSNSLRNYNIVDKVYELSTSRYVLPDTFNTILRPSSIFCG